MRPVFYILFYLFYLTQPVFAEFYFEETIPEFKKQTRDIVLFMELCKKVASATGEKKTIYFRDYILDAFLDFDPERIYKSHLLENLGNSYKGATFNSFHTASGYNVEITPLRFNNNNSSLTEFGNAVTEIGVKKNNTPIARDTSYLSYLSFKTASGRISHNTIVKLTENLITPLDPDIIKQMKPENFNVFKNISGTSKKVINQFMTTFPEVVILLDELFLIHSLVKIESFNGNSYTRVNMKITYKHKELNQKYPNLNLFIQQLQDLLKQTKCEFKTKNGNTLLLFDQNGKENYLKISFLTKNGKIIPENNNSNPVFSEAVPTKSIGEYIFYNEMTTILLMKGFTFKTDNITLEYIFEEGETHGRFNVRLISTAETALSEKPFNFIPIWLANFLMPSYMDNLVKDFSTVLHKGNNGKGFNMNYEFNSRDPENVSITNHVSGEIVDNYFIRLGLSIISDRIRPNEKIKSELSVIANRFYNALNSDISGISME